MTDNQSADVPLIIDEEKQFFIRGSKGEVVADTTDVTVVADRILECARLIAANAEPGIHISVTLVTRIPNLDFAEVKAEVFVRDIDDNSPFGAIVVLGQEYTFYPNTPA